MRRATAAALLLFFVLSLIFTYPLPLHLADAVEDRQDALLNVWITAWDGHQLLADPLHLFEANVFHPYPRTLAYSELVLGNGLLALPITAVSGNPVLGYNLALILSFVLSGFGTYLLVLQLTRSPGAGLVAGIIFAFSAYRMTNLAQAQLLTTPWMPFALLALYQLLRHPRPRHLVTFVLFFCLQALSSFYYGLLLALAAFGYLLFDIGYWIWPHIISSSKMTQHTITEGDATRITYHASHIKYLLLAACCLLLLILPFALPYFQVQSELGFERTLTDSEPFSASLKQYLMVPPGSVLHGGWLPSDDMPITGGYPVDALFPGFVALALGALGLIRGRGPTRWFFLLLILASFILSLGPRLYLAPGQPSSLDVKLPYAWLYAIVPGFKALRAPARFDALLTLSLAVLAGYGASRQGTRNKEGLVSLLLVSLLLVVESLIWPAAKIELVPVGDQVAPVYHWLAEQPPEPILELPMAFTPSGPKLDYQYFSTYHWHTTPDGYSGFIPPKHGQIVYEMERFPSERSVSLLQALDVRYVIVHTDLYPPARWAEMQATLAQVGDLDLVETFEADQVYWVQPHTFDPNDLEVTAYLPPLFGDGEPFTVYVIAINHGERSYAVQPTELIQPKAVWLVTNSAPITVETTADIPLVISPGGAAVIPVPFTQPFKEAILHSVGEKTGALGKWPNAEEQSVRGIWGEAFPVPARLETWQIPATTHPGDALPVNLTWRALGKIDAYYSVYVKLLDVEGNAIAGWDGQPRNGEAPTLVWIPGETVDDVVTLTIPAEAVPGDYTVEVGMYRAKDLARALTLNEDDVPVDRVVLGVVGIEP